MISFLILFELSTTFSTSDQFAIKTLPLDLCEAVLLLFFIIILFYVFILKLYLFIYLAILGLHCCSGFSQLWRVEATLVVAYRLLIAVASLQALGCMSFSSCGERAWLLCSMRNLPKPRIKPVSPALADGFLTTGPPGKSLLFLFTVFLVLFANFFFPFSHSLKKKQLLKLMKK